MRKLFALALLALTLMGSATSFVGTAHAGDGYDDLCDYCDDDSGF